MLGDTKQALKLLDYAQKLGLEDKIDVQKIHDIINGLKKSVIARSKATKQSFKRLLRPSGSQ